MQASIKEPAVSPAGAWTAAAAACRKQGPHRRAFSSRELSLANERYRAWKAGHTKGIAACLAVKGKGPEGCGIHQVAAASAQPPLNRSEGDPASHLHCLAPSYLLIALLRPLAGQHEDLVEWLQYHRQLGVDHFYIYDTGSQPPLQSVLLPFIQVSWPGGGLQQVVC